MSSFFDTVQRFFTTNPKQVEGLNNTSYMYYEDLLFKKLHSLIVIDGLPNSAWDSDFMKDALFRNGVFAVCNTPYGVLPVIPTLTEPNYIQMPTKMTSHNHMFSVPEKTIGINAELVYMGRNGESFMTFNELVTRYALLLAQVDGSMNTTLMNSRVAHFFEAQSKSQYKTLQKVYDDVSKGKPLVVSYNPGMKDFRSNNTFLNVKNTYIGNDLIITKKAIMNEFLTEVGVPNANTTKRERLNEAEVDINSGECNIMMSYVIDTLNRQFGLVNDMFNLNLSAKLNPKVYDTIQGGATNESN